MYKETVQAAQVTSAVVIDEAVLNDILINENHQKLLFVVHAYVGRTGQRVGGDDLQSFVDAFELKKEAIKQKIIAGEMTSADEVAIADKLTSVYKYAKVEAIKEVK